jgi:hypothetical protein
MPGTTCHEGLTAFREARVIQWEIKLQRLGKPLPDPHQIAGVSSRNFFHCNLVYFGLFHSILVDFPAPGRRQTLVLGLAFPDIRFFPSVPKRSCGGTQDPDARPASPEFRAPRSHSPFFHRGLDIDGPWHLICQNFFR